MKDVQQLVTRTYACTHETIIRIKTQKSGKPRSKLRKFNIVRIPFLPKLIYGFNETPIKIPIDSVWRWCKGCV